MRSILVAALVVFALGASIQPIPNFNIALMAQGTGGMYFDWYIATVYDTTHNWNGDACATVAFMFYENYGIMTNFTEFLDSQKGWIEDETQIYYSMNNEAVLYNDEGLTSVNLFVANWTIYFENDYEVNRAIVVKNNSQGGYTIYALQSVGFLGSYWDITPWLQAHGINPTLNTNYFFLDNWCFVYAPSLVWSVFKNASTLLGDWNALIVYDPNAIYNWNTSCVEFSWSKGQNGLFDFGVSYEEEGHTQEEGPWGLIPDPANATVLIGFYFGDQTTTHTVMEVFYTDVAGNLGIVDNEACFAAFLNPTGTSVSNAMVKLFEGYVNTYSSQSCFNHNNEAYYFPTQTNCANSDLNDVHGRLHHHH